MSLSRLRSLTLGLLAVVGVTLAQTPAPSPVPPPPSAGIDPPPASGALAPTTPKPAPPPFTIEGGGVSFEPMYWFTLSSRPFLRPGSQSTATASASFDFPGSTSPAIGFIMSVPAGREHSVRLSYFRAEGSGDAIAPAALSLFSVGYNQGDALIANYKVQNVKLSWDFLSYTYPSKVRIKTLWELQLASIKTQIDAPAKALNTDSSGNITSNFAEGSKSLIYPTFGLGVERAVSKRFRWETSASGFAIPKHGSIWNAEASGVARLGKMELLGGYKIFSVKTSPKDDAYLHQRVHGPYLALRWYFYVPK